MGRGIGPTELALPVNKSTDLSEHRACKDMASNPTNPSYLEATQIQSNPSLPASWQASQPASKAPGSSREPHIHAIHTHLPKMNKVHNKSMKSDVPDS